MPVLAAAASDETGRTIMMLSAGLIAVAIGLTALTIWYWRFTSPRRRAVISAAAEVARSTTEEGPAGIEEPAPVVPPPIEPSPIEPILEPDSQVESEPAPPSADEGSPMGLDSEQWAMLTQAVMDEYLDS